MLVIYGLGNHGQKYAQTRHNAGLLVLQKWVELENLEWQKKDKFAWAKTILNDEMIYFVHSLGYMNESGQALLNFLQYFKLDFSKDDCLIILQDDSDQISGKQKFVIAGGSAGHHGINDIYRHLTTYKLDLTQIWRLKIGIRPEGNRGRSEHFVLQSLSIKENDYMNKVGEKCFTLRQCFAQKDWSKVQQELNSLI